MISELINSLFLTYLASEYLVTLDNSEILVPGSIIRSRSSDTATRNGITAATVGAVGAAATTTTTLKQRLTGILTLSVIVINVVDRWIGISVAVHELMDLCSYSAIPLKVVLAATAYVLTLYVDIHKKIFFFRPQQSRRRQWYNGNVGNNSDEDDNNEVHSSHSSNNNNNNNTQRIMPFWSIFLPKVGWAFLLRVLPAYPFLAVMISVGFLFVINLWEFLHLPNEWLNMPIYYGVFYGPLAYTYVHVKQQVVCYESNTLPI
jgi:hypothetical protein